MKLAQDTAEAMVKEAVVNKDYAQRLSEATSAIRATSKHRIQAMLELARPHLAVETQDLDSDAMLFNLANGTLDLRTFELKPHNPAQLITKLSPVVYDPQADCKTWINFLKDVTGDDDQLISYLQRAAAYSMIGSIKEHAVFMLWGRGCNGKTTFAEALRYVFGDYAKTAPFEAFTKNVSPSAPRNELAMLYGSRFVTASESENGAQMAESILKQIAGGDEISARLLYSEHFSFTPTFKIWMLTNHRPAIRGTDHGIWRRIKPIPFSVRIPDDRIDLNLPAKLRLEAPGILRWMVDGLKKYKLIGLAEPDCIKRATEEYRSEQDPIGRFIADRCQEHELVKAPARDLYSGYRSWAIESGEVLMDEKGFVKTLQARGYDRNRTKLGMFWNGIALVEVPAGVGCRVM
jgi:putative DNA primase/helicase